MHKKSSQRPIKLSPSLHYSFISGKYNLESKSTFSLCGVKKYRWFKKKMSIRKEIDIELWIAYREVSIQLQSLVFDCSRRLLLTAYPTLFSVGYIAKFSHWISDWLRHSASINTVEKQGNLLPSYLAGIWSRFSCLPGKSLNLYRDRAIQKD